MNRKDKIIGIALFVLVSFFSIEPVRATLYMPVDIKGFARVMNAPGALAFWGKVLEMKDVERGREYTFEVIEVLKGDLKDKTVKLSFVGPSKSSGPVQVIRDISLPNLYPGYEVVLFTTPGSTGYYSVVGGEAQGLFYVKYYDGKPAIYNQTGNENIIRTETNDSVMKNAILQMKQENTGAMDFDSFKKLFNESTR